MIACGYRPHILYMTSCHYSCHWVLKKKKVSGITFKNKQAVSFDPLLQKACCVTLCKVYLSEHTCMKMHKANFIVDICSLNICEQKSSSSTHRTLSETLIAGAVFCFWHKMNSVFTLYACLTVHYNRNNIYAVIYPDNLTAVQCIKSCLNDWLNNSMEVQVYRYS